MGCLPHLDAHVAVDLEEAGLAGVRRHLAEGVGGEHGEVVRLILPVPRHRVCLGIACKGENSF